MKILKFLDVIKTYQNYLIRCRMPNYASWPNLAWKSPLLVLFLLLCQNDLKQWKIDIFGGSGVMKILKFLDVIKTYQNYLIRCRMPNYASWPNLAWKSPLLVLFFATLSKWPKTVKNWHFWWVRVMKILKFLDVIKTYQNYLIRCRMPNYASWPNLAWKSPLLVPLLLLCQNDLKQWKIDIFGGSRVMKILKFLDVIKTYQNYLIRCRMPNYASWPNFAWKSPLLVPLLLLCQNDLKQWKIDIFGGSGVMKILKFLDVIKTYQNYLIRCRIPNYASWPNFAWKSPLLVAVLLLCQNDLKQWKIDIFGGSGVMKILKFLDVIKTYQNYLIRCRMPNYASWPNLAWKSPLLVLFLLLCQNDLKQWKIDIFGGSGVMKILKFLDVIKTYQNYLIRCRMPNYASWPNFAWKSPLLVPLLLLCQNDLKQWKIDIFGGSGVMKILKFLDVIKTYQNYLIRCRMPNYASWPNFAWKYQLLVAVLLLCQNDLKLSEKLTFLVGPGSWKFSNFLMS